MRAFRNAGRLRDCAPPARGGQEIIDWSAGEPDFDTPENICDAAIQAIRDGQTRYTSVGGTPALRAAIAHKFHRDNKLHFEPTRSW